MTSHTPHPRASQAGPVSGSTSEPENSPYACDALPGNAATHATALADVAVLMPAYNGQADVERALASFSETSTIHVLIVDDGSTPPIVAPTLPGMAVEVLRMPRNGGIERALEAGIDALAARGYRYAARLDAGDLATPGRLAKQRAYLEAHPQVVGLGMWIQVVSRDGASLFMLRPPVDAADIRRQRFFRMCLAHPSMMLRVDAVRAAGNYRATYPSAEDLDLFLRMMKRGSFANLPELGLHYEINESGISATRRRRQIGSTLRLQLRYFNVLNPYDWMGLAKNLLHLVMPYQTLQRVKRALLRARSA